MYRSIAADGRVDLRVIFADSPRDEHFDVGFGRVVRWQDDILEGYDHIFVKTTPKQRAQGVVRELERFAPDAVYVHGYALPYLRKSMDWARANRKPVLMTTDSELLHPRPLPVRAVKRLVLPRILRQVDLFLTVGDENERYFRHYGVPEERMKRVTFPIDSEYYQPLLERRTELREQQRSQWGISPETTVFLIVGKLIPRKGHGDLIRAFQQTLERTTAPAVVLVAGDGPDRAALEALATPLKDCVHFLGFVHVNDLPSCYLASDVYVHPSSHDPHPLAISEANFCGLPIIASDSVGSVGSTDDVQPGRNGWVYPTGNITALSDALTAAIQMSPAERERASALSSTLGQAHAAPFVASGFIDGALEAIARKTKP